MIDIIDLNRLAQSIASGNILTENNGKLPSTEAALKSLIRHESREKTNESISLLPIERLNSTAEKEVCKNAVMSVIETGQFTTGSFVSDIENFLANFYGTNTCIATSSGTDAICIALRAMGVGPGDEVIVPPNSFAATENAIFSTGAIPVYADIDVSFNLDPDVIKNSITGKTKAIIPVCLYGSARNIEDIYVYSKELGLNVIIDASQCFALGHLTNHCDATTLSFNPYKNIGGVGKSGALLSKSTEFCKISREISYHGFSAGEKNIKSSDWGLNGRMDNIQAATILAKLAFFERNALKRGYLAYRYLSELADIHDDRMITLPIERKSNTWHLFPVVVNDKNRNDLIKRAKDNGIHLEIYYPVLSHKGMNRYARQYTNMPSLDIAEYLHSKIVHLPIHNHFSIEEQDRVIKIIHEFFQRN